MPVLAASATRIRTPWRARRAAAEDSRQDHDDNPEVEDKKQQAEVPPLPRVPHHPVPVHERQRHAHHLMQVSVTIACRTLHT